jgi:PAS domain S-box-containing protein
MNADISKTIFVGDSEMAGLMRSHDWSQTSLGAVETWPQSLRSILSVCLNSQFPIAIYWGADHLLLYNDAWRPILGDKHPWSLGRPGREVWSEIWSDIGSELASVLATGKGTFHKDDLLSMYRFGYTEECFFEYTFNPIQGQGGVVEGVFNVVTETTYRVLNERRAQLLREIAAKPGIIKTAEESCALIIEALKSDPLDIPFALLYLIDQDGKYAHLYGSTEFAPDSPINPVSIDLTKKDSADDWLIARAVETLQAQVITDLPARFGTLPGSPWPELPQEAMVLPILATSQSKATGVLVAVASPRRRLDKVYRDFLNQIAGQIALAIANAQAYEEERKRAESLAELDRAKTIFFNNISHEFRTPLTLMLNPLEDILANSDLSQGDRQQLEIAYRNSQRLLKLVNTLLDFSRIEAGRVQAIYEPTDLATLTADLAGVFRSAIEQAGMRLQVDCPPLPELVYVDREMWEKIILNLLSNAFKFTFEGEIGVSLQWGAGEMGRWGDGEIEDGVVPPLLCPCAVLEVRDTGTGIPADELPHIFERFHRVEGAIGRSYEGSGIGLSLVQELVRLHGGTIQVSSVVDQGTCFTVSIPTGCAHLPRESVNTTHTLTSTATGINPYVEEILRWLPNLSDSADRSAESISIPVQPKQASIPTGRILLADDNADMRDYLKRLLSQQYEVETVANGAAALAAIRQQLPDLVLADVMMPEMDGFELLRLLRNPPLEDSLRSRHTTQDIPIILLSARAGEEARIEGLEAGADDYLIKPFSARELLARIEANLRLAQLRREATQREQALNQQLTRRINELQTLFDLLPVGVAIAEDPDCRVIRANPSLSELIRVPIDANASQSAPSDKRPPYRLCRDGEELPVENLPMQYAAIHNTEVKDEVLDLVQPDGTLVKLLSYCSPLLDEQGNVRGALGVFVDITRRVATETALRDREQRLDLATTAAGLGIFEWNVQTGDARWENQRMYEIFGRTPADGTLTQEDFINHVIHPDDRESFEQCLSVRMQSQSFHAVCRIRRHNDQQWRWVEFNGHFLLTADKTPLRLVGVLGDVTERKQAQEALQESEDRLRLAIESAQLGTWDWNLVTNELTWDAGCKAMFGLPPDAQTNIEIFYRGLHPDQRDRLQEIVQWSLNPESGGGYDTEYRVVGITDGIERWVAAKGQVYFNLAHEPVRFVGTVLNITDRKRIAAEREQILAREQAAREEAEATNRIKDEFLAIVSHELRSPLNPILGWATLLRGRQLNQQQTERALEVIERNAQIQAQLINDLLDVSRILRGKLSLDSKPVDLVAIIEAAVETVRLAAEAKSIQIHTEIAPDVGRIIGDAGRLQQIVWNLLSNAVKFTSEGGQVKICLSSIPGQSSLAEDQKQIDSDQRQITHYPRQTTHYAQLTVTDTGKGIPPDFLPYVFERFRQESSSTTRQFGGLGLGLAIVRYLVELHGGTVQADSLGEGQGATFTLRLPLLRSKEDEEQGEVEEFSSTSTNLYSLTGLRILVVDDDDNTREFLTFLLELHGANVTATATASEALVNLVQFKPDILLSDIGMPDVDGYMLMRQIRALPSEQGRNIPAIALTAYAGEIDYRKAMVAGFQQHIAKPIEPEVLIGAIANLVKQP